MPIKRRFRVPPKAAKAKIGGTTGSEELREELYMKRIILMDGDVTEESCAEWIGRIALLDLKGQAISKKTGKQLLKPITIFVNSYGGDLYAGLGIADVIKNTTCPVNTVCIGVAMSCGSIILSAGKERAAVPNARIMVHQHWDEPPAMTATEIENYAQENRECYNLLVEYYESVCKGKLTREQIDALLKKDSYLSPEQAKDMGMIDHIGWDLAKWVK